MKAVRMHNYGGPSVLRYEEVPIPVPEDGEVLVKVHSAAVNPLDWKIRHGFVRSILRHQLPLIPGWDAAGTIGRVGSAVKDFKIGDRVFCYLDVLRNGSYAEYVLAGAEHVAHAPTSIPPEQAAGIPLAASAAWISLFDKANLKSGQSVIILGASGGVGCFAVQLAKHAGAHVIGVTSSRNMDLIESLGADEVVDYTSGNFTDEFKQLDVVFDLVGGDTQVEAYPMLRKGGVLVSIVDHPPDDALAQKYEVMNKFAVVEPSGTRLRRLSELVDAGKLRTVIEREFPLQEAAVAQELSASQRARGKIILRVS